MKIELIAFTDKGNELGKAIAEYSEDSEDIVTITDGRLKVEPLTEWVSERFEKCEAFIFIGAIGIAVRAIAPSVKSKVTDPAVVVIDENANFVVPILSGHIGRANQISRRLSCKLSAICVITTATDTSDVFAVDDWAVTQDIEICNPKFIKHVSAKFLAGQSVYLYTNIPIDGELPKQMKQCNSVGDADIYIGFTKPDKEKVLWLAPKILTLGIGCRRGKSCLEIEEVVTEALKEMQISIGAVCNIASIDLKHDEVGLLQFAKSYHRPISFYSSEQLNSIEGKFTNSLFVKSVVGTENVCERSALAYSKGELVFPKLASNGITVSGAVSPYSISFSEQ